MEGREFRHELGSLCRGEFIYIHDENGDCVLVEATPEDYRERGRFTPPNPPKKKQTGQMSEKAFAYPVIANGRLYIRDLESLWVYDIKAK